MQNQSTENNAALVAGQKTVSKPLVADTQTGSLMNHLFSGMRMEVPTVGMGATLLCWSDRHAATVTEVSKSGKRIGIIQDIATRVDGNGMSESQEYTFTPGDGGVQYFTLRKNGAWVREGESMRGQRLAIGDRDEYHDFSF